MVTLEALFGLSRDSIDSTSLEVPVHSQVVGPLLGLKEAASLAGFDLCLASGWRSFERQQSIWNRKVSGDLPILDDNEEPIDISTLDERALVLSILRWSAMPGASRHHWGTEVDIYERSLLPEGYRLQLTVDETRTVLAPFYVWLSGVINDSGFYRPYAVDTGGIAPEPWHLSYYPVARDFEAALNPEQLCRLISASDIGLKDVVVEMFGEIWERFLSPG